MIRPLGLISVEEAEALLKRLDSRPMTVADIVLVGQFRRRLIEGLSRREVAEILREATAAVGSTSRESTAWEERKPVPEMIKAEFVD